MFEYDTSDKLADLFCIAIVLFFVVEFVLVNY